jgi:hypothetical protein
MPPKQPPPILSSTELTDPVDTLYDFLASFSPTFNIELSLAWLYVHKGISVTGELEGKLSTHC